MDSFSKDDLDIEVEFVLPEKHGLPVVPPFLTDGRKLHITITGCDIDYEVDIDSWNYPDGDNTRHEEASVKFARVKLGKDDLSLFTEDGDEINRSEVPKELWSLLIRHAESEFPVEDYHEYLIEDYTSAQDRYYEDDRRYDD